jgi:hypothetical protein
MPVLVRRITFISLIAAISLVAASCGESKVSQCNKLITVVNKAANDARSLGQSSGADKTAQLDKFSQLADKLDGYTNELNAIDLKDETLKGLRTQFIKMYRGTGASSRELVTAVKAKNSKAANTAVQALQVATAQEPKLVSDANKYCQGS